ncbi:hypothetical protein Pfo_002299 [Paulownia fortunei]|nr:hypothetical protein Pfo_002299 [Paulownia fortunei]
MSSTLPLSDDPYNIIEGSEFLSPLDPWDDSWSLYQEILQSAAPAHIINGEINNRTSEATANSAAVHEEQQHFSTPQAAGKLDNGFKLMKISTPNSKTRKKNRKVNNENAAMEQSADEGPSVTKKLDHNAKERIRRMKVNASYLALRALLPDSRRSKKRWSAPAIVDRVLKYIPELENEVEALRSKKENVQSAAKNKKISTENPSSQYETLTVSFNKVNQEEAIIQICMAREDDQDGLAFTNLMQSVEDEGICIKSASTIYICERRICYHLHIQINHSTPGADCFEELRDKVISWLR